ncbi:MAG: LamG domain-containing protein [Lentisphaeria bacterium]|nr:LamG domain-containing protein [Lentisphaeria bacterium]
MDSKNLLHIGNFQEFQPFIIVDDRAFPIGYDTRSCTAGAADIIRGKTAATSSGVVEGVLDAGNNYFVCTSVVSDTQWKGCKITIEDNVLRTEGGETAFTAEKNTPEPGRIYDRSAQFLVALNEPAVSVMPYENVGGQVNDKIGLKLNAKAENKSDDEISYTLVSAPEWMSFSNRVLSGTPEQAGDYYAEIKVEADNCMPVLVRADINIISPVGDAVFYLPLQEEQTRAETGQYLVTGKGVYNPSQYYDYLRPEFVTYDGYKCAKFVAGYTWDDDTGEEYSFITSVETNELANIEDTAQRSVSFLACPRRFYGESEWGDDTNSSGSAIEWGQGGQHLMFKVCPAYSYVYDEETGEEGLKHIVAVSLWNGDIDIDTGLPCDNKMHHYALSMDCTGDNSGTMKLYVDGSEVWSGWFSWGTPHTVDSPISIGKMYGDNGYNYEGYLAEVKVWNRILSASEVSAEYSRVAAMKTT